MDVQEAAWTEQEDHVLALACLNSDPDWPKIQDYFEDQRSTEECQKRFNQIKDQPAFVEMRKTLSSLIVENKLQKPQDRSNSI